MKTHPLTGLKSLEESREALQKRIRIRAYQLYENADEKTVTIWMIGYKQKRRKCNDGRK